MAAAMPAGAAETFADVRLRQQFEYDTNIDLSPDERSGFGSRSVVGALVGTRTRAVDLALDGEFRLVRFPGESDLDSEDAKLEALGSWEWRRSALELSAGVLRDTTRDVLDRESALLAGANEERLTFETNAEVSHRFTPLDTGVLGFGFRHRMFPSVDDEVAEAADLEEFSFYDLQAQWGRQVSRVLGARAVLGTTYFDSDSEQANSVQVRVGGTYALTPALELDGTIGPTIVAVQREEAEGGDETTVGALWNLGLEYRPSRDATFQAQLFQEFDPQSDGGSLDARTGLEVEFDYLLTRRTTFRLPALIQRQDPVGGDGEARNYARIQPTLSHQILPRLSLDTSYRFRAESIEGDEDATSHAVFVSLTYDLPSLLSSR